MIPGLLLGMALGSPPNPSLPAPVPAETHKDAVARFGAAIWNLRRDRLLTSARQFEEAARKDPAATEPQRELVRLYTLLGREPDAIRTARLILIRNPDDFEIAHTLTKLLFDAGEVKEALAVAKVAAASPIPVAQAEKAVGIFRDLATLCVKAREPAAAEASLRKTIELVVDRRRELLEAGAFTPREIDRAAAECYERLGKVLTTLRKFEEATTAFTNAATLASDPKKAGDPSALSKLDWNLSAVLQARGEPQAALNHLNRLLKLQPLFPDPYLRLAQLLRELGRENDIIPELERLRRISESGVVSEKNLPLLTVLATELARSSDLAGNIMADQLFETVMKASNDPKLMTVILHSHLERGKPGQIVAEVDRIFVSLKESDDDGKMGEMPTAVETRAFAAEKVRTIAGILNDDAEATAKVLDATRLELRAGTKRTHQTLLFLGRLAARHDKLGLAEALFSDAVLTAPKETRGDAYVAYIELLRLAGKPAKLAEACRNALRDVDTIAPFYFHYHLSEAMAELGRAEEAIAAADQAIRETGHNNRLMLWLHKVTVLRILDKWDDALALANKLYEDFPGLDDRLQIRLVRASTYWAAGKRDESDDDLRAVLEQDPDQADACNELGYHLADLGRNLDEAERLIRHAIEVDRYDRKKSGAASLENPAYIDSLGWVLFRKGLYAAAREQLEKAASANRSTTDPIFWDHLGDVSFRQGDTARAKVAWQKAAELYANDARVSHRNADRLAEATRKLKRIP